MLRFTCPNCKTLCLHFTSGEKVYCPMCGQEILVPGVPAPPPQNETVLGTWEPSTSSPPAAAVSAAQDGEELEVGSGAKGEDCPDGGTRESPQEERRVLTMAQQTCARSSRKSVNICVRLSAREIEALREQADSEGISLSIWIRRTLFHAAGLPVQDAMRPNGRPPGER